TIAGTANFVSSGSSTSGNITLSNATHNFTTVTASGTNITIADTNATTFNGIIGSNVNVTSGGNLTVNSTGISATGDVSLQANNTSGTLSIGGSGIDNQSGPGTITLTGGYFEQSAGVIKSNSTIAILTLQTININGGTIQTPGNVTLNAANAISQTSGNIVSGGTANIVSTGFGTKGNITLNNATNLLNYVTTKGTNITIVNSNATQMGLVRAGNLTFTATSGSITQDASTNMVVSGTANFIALSGAVSLTNATNSFGTLEVFSTNVTMVQNGPVNLGNVSLTNLTISATGAITQNGSLTITSTANFVTTGTGTAGNITLNNLNNNFSSGVAIYASGTNITIVNSNSSGTQFGNVNATGCLTVNATNGPITQAIGTNLTVNGTASFVTTGTGTSGNITLLNLTNKFGRFDARGTNISVSD
ncbi:MAG: beta strand repeat-containing protein, partial [bacterium]